MKRGRKKRVSKVVKAAKAVENIKKDIGKDILLVKKFFKDVCLPEYMIDSDVGLDLRANENITLEPMEQKAVRTGMAIKIPEGHVGLIRDRAGIVSKMNVHTAAGTFDPAYRGELSIVLINFAEETVEIEKGMRVAQLIILPVKKVKVVEVDKLPVTERYDRGFGSTGIKNEEKNENIVKELKFEKMFEEFAEKEEK